VCVLSVVLEMAVSSGVCHVVTEYVRALQCNFGYVLMLNEHF